ncbi:DNA polymerase III subunit gamma/tau [Patescibacteria group bacterium]|nr:DNA polymerase III subunit gamma/tau [Patescibacteria group bacterium]
MTETIYRKYRPSTFAEVIGQDHVKTIIEQEIINNKLTHAYLFCGTRGVGKTTMARLLAKSINCETRKNNLAEPCNKCQSCLEINKGRSLDLIEIDAASNRRIDDIREVRDKVPYGPARSKYKVVIIDEVHMLTNEAFNALLKTLEEPPAHVIFILATTEPHKLPETILSRCQRFDFHRLAVANLMIRLKKLAAAEKVDIAEDVLREVAHLANGSTRDAESYLGKLLSLNEATITYAQAGLVLPRADAAIALGFIGHLVNNSSAQAIAELNDFLLAGGDLGYFYSQVLELLRKLLLYKLGGNLTDYSSLQLKEEQEKELAQWALKISQNALQRMMVIWLEVDNLRKQSQSFQIPLELAVINICQNEESITKPSSKINPPAAKTNQPLEAVKPILAPVVEPAEPQQPKLGAKTLSAELTLEKINQDWAEVINKLRDLNHSLSFILSIAKPFKLVGNELTISFQYKLHQERVRDKKIRQQVEDVLSQVIGGTILVKTEMEEVTKGKSGDLLSNVLSTFGGELV